MSSDTRDATEEPLPAISSHVYRRLRLPDSDIRILFQKTSYEKVSKERMHLDLETDDIEAEVKRLEARSAARCGSAEAGPGCSAPAWLTVSSSRSCHSCGRWPSRRRTARTQSVCPVQAAPDKGSCPVKLGPAGDC